MHHANQLEAGNEVRYLVEGYRLFIFGGNRRAIWEPKFDREVIDRGVEQFRSEGRIP